MCIGWKVSVYRAGVWEEPVTFTDYSKARKFFLALDTDKTVRASTFIPIYKRYPTKPASCFSRKRLGGQA